MSFLSNRFPSGGAGRAAGTAAAATDGGVVQFTLRSAKEKFIDADKIEYRVDRANVRNLSRYGAYVRADAKENIRSRGRPSKPGQGPTNQTGLLKRHIYFVVEPPTNVVIGPAGLPNVAGPGGKHATSDAETVPELLEFGGTVQKKITRGFLISLYKRRHRSEAARSMFKALRPQVGNIVQFNYEPRPYIGPAQEDNQDQVPRIWENSVR